jgi:hypothetical protein
MHTALVQRLMRDRSAWELAYGFDEPAEAQRMVPAAAGILPVNVAAHA